MFEDGLGVLIDQVKEVMNADILSGYSGRFIGRTSRYREVVRHHYGLPFCLRAYGQPGLLRAVVSCSLRECG